MKGDFYVESNYIKSIGGVEFKYNKLIEPRYNNYIDDTVGGAKRKHIPLDKCTVAELKAKAAKRGLKVTGLKKADIIAKLRS